MAAKSMPKRKTSVQKKRHLNALPSRESETQLPLGLEFFHSFAKLFEFMRQCYWIADTGTGQNLTHSENFEEVWGHPGQLLSEGMTSFMDSVAPEDRDRVLSDFHLSLAQPEPKFDIELRIIDSTGETRWIWLRGFSLPRSAFSQTQTPDSATSHLLLFLAEDITKKKTQESTLRDRELKMATYAKTIAIGELANGVAHEINNPLTIIVGKTNELQRLTSQPSLNTEQMSEIAAKIQATSMRISRIVTSLKMLATPRKNIPMTKTPIAKIFRDISDLCQEKLKNGGVDLILPSFPAEFSAEMNPTLITQLFLNLVNNSFDAIQSLAKKWIQVDFAEDESSIFVYVTDSGSGIPIKIRGRIFDPFFTTKDPSKGTGLGLCLSAGFAHHHNGSIILDTTHIHTRFAVQLPKKQPAALRSAG